MEIYYPLDPSKSETRLLSFIVDETSDTVEMSIETINLDLEALPEYYALSYEWNPPGVESYPDYSIWVNGTEKLVSQNLKSALLHFQRYFKKGSRVWIDALCIDQNNKSELNY